MRVGILTVSDKGYRGERDDTSGPAIKDFLMVRQAIIAVSQIVPDDQTTIEQVMVQWSDELGLDMVLTTGGTGFAPRDVTPEATLNVIDKQAPGFGEAMRAASLKITAHAMLSRAVAGIRGRTLIVNMPGSPKAVRECLEVMWPAIPHALELLRESGGECATT